MNINNQQITISEFRTSKKGTYFLFFLQAFFLPPVARLLCMESREIPIKGHKVNDLLSFFFLQLKRLK